MTKRPLSSVTTILAYLVGRSLVSAMTQMPASGPCAPVTVPPISSASMVTGLAAPNAGDILVSPCPATRVMPAMPARMMRAFDRIAGFLQHGFFGALIARNPAIGHQLVISRTPLRGGPFQERKPIASIGPAPTGQTLGP